jgi:hypothetical protein
MTFTTVHQTEQLSFGKEFHNRWKLDENSFINHPTKRQQGVVDVRAFTNPDFSELLSGLECKQRSPIPETMREKNVKYIKQ